MKPDNNNKKARLTPFTLLLTMLSGVLLVVFSIGMTSPDDVEAYGQEVKLICDSISGGDAYIYSSSGCYECADPDTCEACCSQTAGRGSTPTSISACKATC